MKAHRCGKVHPPTVHIVNRPPTGDVGGRHARRARRRAVARFRSARWCPPTKLPGEAVSS